MPEMALTDSHLMINAVALPPLDHRAVNGSVGQLFKMKTMTAASLDENQSVYYTVISDRVAETHAACNRGIFV